MSPTDLRRQAKRRIDMLSPGRLQVADDFLAYLEERESGEATFELLEIAGFSAALAAAETEIAQGDLTPVDQLRRKR